MAKKFSVPPVIFPSSDTSTTTFPFQRRAPTVPYQPFQPFQPSQPPPRPSNPHLPFFDTTSTSTSTTFFTPSYNNFTNFYTSDKHSTTTTSGFGFEEELPLLEELGINTTQIWRKTVTILNPIKPNANLHEDADLSGPFLYLLAFGLFQLLAGKIHFGIILGWVTVCAGILYIVFNMLAGRNGDLDLYRCLSLVGYGMLPMVMFSAVSLFVPKGGVVVFGVGVFFVLWSTRVCSRLLVELASCGDEHKGLIAYACFLIYSLFSLLVIF